MDSTTLHVLAIAVTQLLILSLAWAAPHVVYVGDIDPHRYGEQARTVLNVRFYLILPATVALCWWGVHRWLDTRHDVAIVLYIAVCCRLVMFVSRLVREVRGLSWLFVWTVGPSAALIAILDVTARIADSDPSPWGWIAGGVVAVLAPVFAVIAGGWLASRTNSRSASARRS